MRLTASLTSIILLSSFCLCQSAQAQYAVSDKSRAIHLYNESVALINSSKLPEAEAKLVEALQIDPQNANSLNNYGLVLLKLGKLQEARKALEKSIELNPKFDAPYLNLGLVCEGQGDLAYARQNFLKYIDISGNRAQADKMRDHVNIIDKTLANGPLPAQAQSSEDYFTQLRREQLFPWPADRMPLKIFVEAGDNVPGYKKSFGDDFQQALATWAEALKEKVSFEAVGKEDGADIVVRWTHDPKNALLKAEGGDCKYNANGEGMNHALITLLTIDPSASDKLNDFKVSWVSLHELGHALGVNGHSNNPGDIMYFAAPLQNTMPKLSQRDVATFKRLYSEKLADTWLSLNDQAIKLMRSGQLKEALSKLNSALILAPKERVLKENLVLVEAKIATALLEDEKYAEAEPHLQKALELEKEAKDQNFDVLLRNYSILLKRTGRANEVDALYKRHGAKSPGQ